MLIQDENKRSKTIDTTLTQVWTKKGEEATTTPDNDSNSKTNEDLYEFSKKVRSEQRKHSRESSERRLAISPSSNPPSTVLCSSSTVAGNDANESDESNEFVKKRKRRSTSQSSRTTTISSHNNCNITPPKNRGSQTCDACFRKDNKIADLRTKCAQLKGARDALREKQLLVHRITSVDTEFLHSADRSGYKK